MPDGSPADSAMARTTHMCISARQDNIEIMAYHGILECFGNKDKGFMGVVVTNGSGSPRDGLYASYTDEMMQIVRREEQKKAAIVGEYCAQALLDFTSSAVKDPKSSAVVEDLKQIISAARPEVIYTHNPADRHDTHIAVALRVIRAVRELPAEARPKRLYGCEVWRDLDWLNDEDKVVFRVDGHENLAAALLGIFDSQICGGKRYDLATFGRRRAHATYHTSHGTDDSTGLNFAMDLTPLINDASLDVIDYVAALYTASRRSHPARPKVRLTIKTGRLRSRRTLPQDLTYIAVRRLSKTPLSLFYFFLNPRKGASAPKPSTPSRSDTGSGTVGSPCWQDGPGVVNDSWSTHAAQSLLGARFGFHSTLTNRYLGSALIVPENSKDWNPKVCEERSPENHRVIGCLRRSGHRTYTVEVSNLELNIFRAEDIV